MSAIPQIDDPQVGFYQIKLVKKGPFIPVRIWDHIAERDEAGDLMEDEGLRCQIDGEEANPYEQWVYFGNNPITEAEYNFMVADSAHAKKYRPDDAKATPRKAISLSEMKSIF